MSRLIDALSGPRAGLGLIAILVALLVLVPPVVGLESYAVYLAFTILLYATFGHAWNLLAGFCGLLSFGNQVYVGLAGFTVGILFYYGRVDVWLAVVIGGVVAAAFAFLLAIPVKERFAGRNAWKPIAAAIVLWIAYEAMIELNPALDVMGQPYVRRVFILLLIFLGALPLLRLQGPYFAVATWLIAESVGTVFNEWNVVGAGGGMQIRSDARLPQLYYAALLLAVLSTVVVWRLLRSRYGLALTAVRDSEEAAATVGIDVRRVKMLVFLIAGAMTGLAAGLFWVDAGIITPPSAFTVLWSAHFVFVVVAGGMGTLAGPLVGAVLFVLVDRILAAFLEQGLLVLGAASILIILFMPRGVMGLVHDALHGPPDAADGREALGPRLLLALAGRRAGAVARRAPGLVAAYLVPGTPLPLMRPDNAPWQPLAAGMEAARRSLAEARPDAIIVYSTQWVAVLDQLWQTRARLVGLHVDDTWHDLGNLRFDIRTDVDLAAACVEACREAGITARGVDHEGFPVDTGTIAANAQLNPDGRVPLVIAANNIYHDWETTRRLGEIAVARAIDQGKRVAVLGVGGLSGTRFRTALAPADDRLASSSDDAWNRDVLAMMERGDVEGLMELAPLYAREARVDMGFKHLAFLLGAMGGRFTGAAVLGYGPDNGAGAAVVEFQL